jgi:hypothetical protein
MTDLFFLHNVINTTLCTKTTTNEILSQANRHKTKKQIFSFCGDHFINLNMINCKREQLNRGSLSQIFEFKHHITVSNI